MSPDAALARLAAAAGVAVTYEAAGSTVEPPERTLRAVLGALGHPCGDHGDVRRSLAGLRSRPWTRPIDLVVVRWRDDATPARVTVSAGQDDDCELRLTLEDGSGRRVPSPVWGGTRVLDDDVRRRGTVELPANLPLGYHRLTLTDRGQPHACTVIVAPPGCPDPGDRRRWGWMVQAYALRSARSWGQGEFPDLGTLAADSAAHGADFVLINPVHAIAPTLPQQASPYSPTSRRFVNPCYLHLPDLQEFGAVPARERDALGHLPPELRAGTDRIDRDRVWAVKRAALQRMFEGMRPERREQLACYRRERGDALERFARFCALAEVHGLPFDEWPEELRDPRTPAVDRWTADHAALVALHAWLQLLCDEQLAAAQERARRAGMAVGIVNDLAVGVDPGGADVWALPGEFARGMSVGAPPDAFNQQGQNWAQPPPLPDVQRATGFRTFREVVRASLRAAGGLRIDHILGLSRLFWIPDGSGPAEGTYVRYPAEEQFAVLALESHRAGAIVVGEDLGNVDDRIRRLMRRRGVASSAVLYFEQRPARSYPRTALASVTTHDLPTATGFWDGSALDLRIELKLLSGSEAEERRRFEDDQRTLLRLLRTDGSLNSDAPDDVRARVLAMHRFLARTPSLLVAAALWDALGDPRPPNVPGTVDAYPNWCLPLARPTPSGPEPVTLEAALHSAAVYQMIEALRR